MPRYFGVEVAVHDETIPIVYFIYLFLRVYSIFHSLKLDISEAPLAIYLYIIIINSIIELFTIKSYTPYVILVVIGYFPHSQALKSPHIYIYKYYFKLMN